MSYKDRVLYYLTTSSLHSIDSKYTDTQLQKVTETGGDSDLQPTYCRAYIGNRLYTEIVRY